MELTQLPRKLCGDKMQGLNAIGLNTIDGECDSSWVFANYEGIVAPFDPAVRYDGTVNCPTTCATFGMTAVGARFICNQTALGGPEVTEGCDLTNVGDYGTENCGWMVRDGVELTENGNTEECAGQITSCVSGDCSEGVSYHALQCQCE